MTFRRFFCFFGLLLALSGGLFFLQTHPALAQVDAAGFQEVGEVADMGSADPRIIAARIINIFLGTLGVVLLCLVLYAGFTWMTAGGDTEKVEKAQKIIRNAIIGLIIIISSWAFVSFIIKRLTGITEGETVAVPSETIGALGTAGGSLAFQVRSITPAGAVRIRNVEPRFLFSREVLASTASSSISVVRASDNEPVPGTVAVRGALVTFVPTQACPAPNTARKCFAENTEYIARVGLTVRSRSGLTIACGRAVPPCEMRFKTGTIVDVSPPSSTITNPLDGQGIPAGDSVRVTVRSTDDGGISLTEVYVDDRMIGSDAGSASTTPNEYDATVVWDTRDVATGTHEIKAQVWDVDSNSVTTTAITVAIRPRNFFNGIQDGPGLSTDGMGGLGLDGTGSGSGALNGTGSNAGGTGRSGRFGETGVDCGGPSGGYCAGASCNRGVDCASGICLASRCIEQPIIGSFSPTDGRPGTYVTITGINFGSSTGQVLFAGRPATAPAACAAGSSFWSPTQIVVAVPEGATTSSIQVTHGTNRLSDSSNDERGPRLPDFRVNGVARPGLCTIRPGTGIVGDRSRLVVAGVNLGNTAGQLYFNEHNAAISAWRPNGVDLSAPLVPPGAYAVRARVGGMESNPVSFQFSDRVLTSPPTIDQLRPATGTVGSYVTLVGRNFGNAGRVFFRNTLTNAVGEADTFFPALCGSAFWGDTAIMVKVPRTLRDGLNQPQDVRSGAYEVYVQRDGLVSSNRRPFTVFDGMPGPGICAIQPVAGPVGTGLTIVGENFGTSVGSVTFAGTATTTRPTAFLTGESWRAQEIRTRVPLGASTGMVRVSAGGRELNDAFFSVASCVLNPGVCGTSLACCPDGSCAVGGICPSIGVATSTFAWRSSTGRIYQHPRVVEECNNEQPPSPSPRSLSTCINAQAVVRFTTHIERSTINSTNVIVRRCTGTTGDPCATGTPETVAGTLAFFTGATQDHFVFTPAGNVWRSSGTYQIILTTGIRAPAADGGRAMLENADAYGRGNAYAYRFQTKSGTDLCTAGSVSVVPFNWTMAQLGDVKDDYTLSARSAEDMCVQINGDTLGWSWGVSNAGQATVVPNNSPRSSSSTVTGIGATDREPVLINVELRDPLPPVPVRGSGQLTVRITPPRVTSYAPNCTAACVNAAVWARFNIQMNRESLFRTVGGRRVPNFELKRCTNESCRETDLTVDLSDAVIDLMTPAGSFATNTMMKIEPSMLSLVPDPVTGETIRTSQLEPGKYYKATVLGGLDGVKSEYGRLPLTDLNESSPVGFTWKFRVKTGADAYCSVARVEVVPSEKYEVAFGMRQLFIASPISAPDVCSRDGQMLISERSTRWETSDPLVSDFVRISGRSASVSLADRLPEYCTNQCLNAGSNGIYGRTAVCGNRTVETVDTDYCRRRSDNALKCVVGSSDCVVRQDRTRACVILPEGSSDAEECDNGDGNGTAGECSASCLWNPVRRVNDMPSGTCGNGTLQVGEQCDTGRVCVGGSTPGRNCTADATVCGEGSCQTIEQRGCSERCQALGAQRGGSTCGNGDVSDGETCDYSSTGRGSGCTNQCLHTGSSNVERRLCGNARIEPGESCEVQTAGNVDSNYCRMVEGVLRCYADTRFSTACDTQTCINPGTARCHALSDAGCCGNNRIEVSEDCDGGPGCSSRCLFSGSSSAYPSASLCGDRVVGTGEQCDAPTITRDEAGDGPIARFEITNRQLFEIVGLREPTPEEIRLKAGRMASNVTATYNRRAGQAIHGVQCNFTREADCRSPGTGLTSGGCCAVRPTATYYPQSGARDVCRNVLISTTFNQLMDEGTVRGNFLVSTQPTAGVTCPTGTRPLDEAVPTAFDWSSPVRSMIARIKAWFSPVIAAEPSRWCIGTVRGTVTFETNTEERRTTASFLLDEALAPNTEYQVTLLGDPLIRAATSTSSRRGIRGANGIYADGNISWKFTTGERVCKLDELRLTDTNASHPTVFYRSNEAHRYVGRAVSYHGTEVVPLSPIPGLYNWAWRDWLSSRPNILRTETIATTPQISMATTTALSQRGTSLITTGVTITADRISSDGASSSTTEGQTRDASLLSTVILCDNPWVPSGTAAGQPPRFVDDFYHFAFNYCRDAGVTGEGDDYPELTINRLAEDPTDTARGIKRQYIFSFDRPSFRSDALGVRIMANPLHLAPKDWYAAQGFGGSPQATVVDGYEALRDGSTVYVSAANVNPVAGDLTTDIYVFSHNPNATPETRAIFEQVIDSLTFNTNILHDADNVCRTQTGALFLPTGSTRPVTCTADWECVRQDARGYCASSKEKIQRDLKRMADLQYISAQLENVKTRDGRYPTINTGTFLQTFVTSRWPSWQSVFAASVGKALPEDPLNVHVSCGQCLRSRQACMEDSDCGGEADRCIAKEGFDPGTCWNAVSSTYRCPMLEPLNPRSVSRLYQYRSVDGGNRYELGTELEYRPIEYYSPSMLPETRRCVSEGASNGRACVENDDCDVLAPDRRSVISTGICTPQGGHLQFGGICLGRAMGLGGICGDGVVGTGEVCEPGQTRQADCPIGDVATAGSRRQVCRSDCSEYVDQPGAVCISKVQCGNGRVETGETCDDGAVNGTYGHCNRSCNGFAAICGDGQLSAGEICDASGQNGSYCDTSGYFSGAACTLNQTCGADCRSVAPHCGDGVVQTESLGAGGPVEECDGNPSERYTGSVCSGGRVGMACDPANMGRECIYSDVDGANYCGREERDRSCSGIRVGLCAGGITNDRGESMDRHDCTCPEGQASCSSTVCGAAYRCVMYDTQRTRSCRAPGTGTVTGKQCYWEPWSACRPANFCGDGVLDAGETCDDGNRTDNDSCTNRCLVNTCGDGIMNIGAEECDAGTRNGLGCTGAEYGSTCAACTNQCRMTASSGGYCGNGVLDGAEQCDGTDFGREIGIQPATGLTCTGLGYAYAERVRCNNVATPTQIIEVAANNAPTSCVPGTVRDIITCSRACGYGGCQNCSATGDATITALVRDAVYPGIPVAGATVRLTQNGRLVATQTTNEQGAFTFTNLNENRSCGSYRVYVEFTRDNPGTPLPENEAANGGYWMYESNTFSVPTFRQEGIQSSENPGKIFLLPKVARNETLVVHTWYGNLQENGNRYLLSHLILPQNRAYRFNRSTNTWNQNDACSRLASPGWAEGQPCYRDIREQDTGLETQGNPRLDQYPHARLFCSTGSGGICYQVASSPQATRYRWNVGSTGAGNFSYFLADQRSAMRSSMIPSYEYYRQTSSTIWVVTQARVYKVLPPTTNHTRCQGKFWLVFQQNSANGDIRVVNDAAEALRCGGETIPGETGVNVLPDSNWPEREAMSWMAFGRWGDGPTRDGTDWDMAGSGPGRH